MAGGIKETLDTLLKDVTDNLKDILKNQDENSYSVFVFGSHVTQETTESSDLDIVCLFDKGSYEVFSKRVIELQQEYRDTPVKLWIGSLEDCLKEEPTFLPAKPVDKDVWLYLGNYYLQFIMGYQGKPLLGRDMVSYFKTKVKRHEIPKEEAYEMYLISTRHLALGYLKDDVGLLSKAVARATLAWSFLESDRIPKSYSEIFKEGLRLLGYVGLEKERFTGLLKKVEAIRTKKDGKLTNEDMNLILDYFELVERAIFEYVYEEGLSQNIYLQEKIRPFLDETSRLILGELEAGEEYDTRFLVFFMEELIDYIYKTDSALESKTSRDIIDKYLILTKDLDKIDARYKLLRAKANYIKLKHIDDRPTDLKNSILNDIDDALKNLEKEDVKSAYLLSKELLRSEAYTLLGKVLLLEGDSERARQELLKALKQNPYNILTLNTIKSLGNKETNKVVDLIESILQNPVNMIEIYSSGEFKSDEELFKSFEEGVRTDSKRRIQKELIYTRSKLKSLIDIFSSDYELVNNILNGSSDQDTQIGVLHRTTRMELIGEEIKLYYLNLQVLDEVYKFMENENLVPFYKVLLEEYYKEKKNFIKKIKLLEELSSEVLSDEVDLRTRADRNTLLEYGYVTQWNILKEIEFTPRGIDEGKIKSSFKDLLSDMDEYNKMANEVKEVLMKYA